MRTQEMKINIGPQHPSTHGVLRLVMTLDGETIKNTEPVIGYLHRGKEKLAESRTYFQYLPMVDRVDYLSSCFNLIQFCMAVESIAGLEVPRRSEFIRIITMEFNRIASHLMWLGSFMLDLGATSPLFYTFRERESIVELLEQFSGSRMMYNAYSFGGVKKDLPKCWCQKALELLKEMPKYFDEYESIITKNPIFLERTKGIGVLDLESAINYGITGANLRASGSDFDLRKASPYSLYNEIDFNVHTASNGDCFDRYIVRIDEMRESIKIIKQAVEKYENEESQELICKKVNPVAFKPPVGEATAMIEAPRGISSCYVISDGTPKPTRVKWRTASFSSVHILPELLKGRPYSDLMAIFGSLDVVLPEVDR